MQEQAIPPVQAEDMTAREFFEKTLARDLRTGFPELPIRQTACHDCAVTGGLYAEFSDELAQLPDLKEPVSRRWFCHNTPGFACKGNADVCGIK